MSVLFVCLGNICRSPAAEAVFAHLLSQSGAANRVSTDSAGTSDLHAGEEADRRMRDAAAARGIKILSRSRAVDPFTDFERFTHIVAMDHQNLSDLRTLKDLHAPGSHAALSLMCSWSDKHAKESVPDPYYGGQDGFEKVLDLLFDACNGLLNHMFSEMNSR